MPMYSVPNTSMISAVAIHEPIESLYRLLCEESVVRDCIVLRSCLVGMCLDCCSNSVVTTAYNQALCADNEELKPPHVEDSRTFGPVPLGNVLGRCVYSFASSVDQGYIQNSTDTKEDDVSIVEVELTEQLKKELEQCKASIQGSG